MLIKLYGQEPEWEKRYSPAKCIATENYIMQGNSDPTKISTSYVERHENGNEAVYQTGRFFKENREFGACSGFPLMYYNFCRPHKSLNIKRSLGETPTMAAGVTDRIWKIEDIVVLSTK